MKESHVLDEVKTYYGKTLQKTEDLKTNACCTVEPYPPHIKRALSKLSDEVLSKYYGCGLTIPDQVLGLRVLDLGCGSGRDCFLLSQLVGEEGSVVGVDMTPEQLNVARQNIEYHTRVNEYKQPNVEFLEGDIQNLDRVGLRDSDFDLIVSNCVLNLVPNKRAVLEGAFRLLKEGGEFYFSDVYCNRRLSKELISDKVLWGECLAGALYWNDFENLAKSVGFKDPRVVDCKPIEVNNELLQNKLEGYKFYSVTYRLFKLKELEPFCEDFGQAVVYKGGVEESPLAFQLDNHHLFKKGKVEAVCGNSYLMLKKTRYANFFEFIGTFDTHYGIFEGCGVVAPFESVGLDNAKENVVGGCC